MIRVPKAAVFAAWAVISLVSSAGCSSTTSTPDAGPDSGDAGSDGGETWTETAIDLGPGAGLELVAAVDPSGNAGVAYFRKDGPAMYAIVVARETSPGVWSKETIANAAGDGGTYLTGHYGLGLAFDPAGNPAVTYMGGQTANSKPGSDGRWTDFVDSTGLSLPSDSVMAKKSTAWTKTTLGSMSNSFVTTGNAVDDQGVVIGLWSAIGFSSDGTAHVVQRDMHYGSDLSASQDANLEYGAFSTSGAEANGAIVASNRTPSSPLVMGAGTGTHMVMVNGQPAISFALSVASTSDSQEVWFAQRTGGGWTRMQVSAAKGAPGHAPSLAYSATRGFAIAYYDAQNGDGRIATSADGVTWNDDPVEVLGDTGLHPAAAFHGADLGVLWAFCRSPIDPAGSCNPDVNELRFVIVNADGSQGPVETVEHLVPTATALLPTNTGSFLAIYQTANGVVWAARRSP